MDDSTGLYFYEARYYDAVLGRFISTNSIVPDPTNPQAFNRYSYVFNNPLRFIDPLGMKPCQVDGCVGEDIFTLPEVLVQDTHITPSENTRSSEGTDSGTPFGTSSPGPFLSSPPSSESETLPSAACCDLTDVIGAPLRGIKAGIGIFGIIGGIKNVSKQTLGNVKSPTAAQLREMLGVSQEEFHRKTKNEILKPFRSDISKFGIKNPDIGLDKGNIVIIDRVKSGLPFSRISL